MVVQVKKPRRRSRALIALLLGPALILGLLLPSSSVNLNQPADTNARYVATNGNDSNPGTLAAPWRTITKATQSLVPGRTVYIRAGTYNERVDLTNLGNAGGPYITFTAYPGEQVVLDGTGLQTPYGGGVFHVWNTDYIRISGLSVRNAPGAGIYVGYADHVIIENNYTYNTYNSGIGVWSSSNVLVDGNEIEFANNGGSEENLTIDGSANVEVRNNEVHHGYNSPYGGEGLNLKNGAHDVIVHHNVVHDLPKYAFGLDGWTSLNNYNIQFYDNVAYNCASGFIVEAEQGGRVENVKVYNNLAYNNAGPGLYLPDWNENNSSPKVNIQFFNNTAYHNGYGMAVRTTNVQSILFRNNIFSQNTVNVEIASAAAAQTTVDHNLFYGSGSPVGGNPVVGDPRFVNPAGGNFHLQSTSPAIDTGSALAAPGDDMDGDARPQAAGYDIGADEVVGGN